jgi:hypothetical protein
MFEAYFTVIDPCVGDVYGKDDFNISRDRPSSCHVQRTLRTSLMGVSPSLLPSSPFPESSHISSQHGVLRSGAL